MRIRIALAVAAAAAVMMSAVSAEAKSTKRHKRHAQAQPATMYYGQGPARMIEVRPGLWISSYGCVTDEGYGRYSPCDLTDGNR